MVVGIYTQKEGRQIKREELMREGGYDHMYRKGRVPVLE